jgi:hypothetical protein
MQRDDDNRAAISRAQNLDSSKIQTKTAGSNQVGTAFGKYAVLLTASGNRPAEKNAPDQKRMPGSTKDEIVTQEPKSYAQVASFVKQQAVQQKSGGLKPEGGKAAFIGIRLSSQERQLVLGRAINSSLKLSAYARAALLGADYVAKHDPVRRKLLQDVSRELGHQGNNLNQIAKQLNSGFITQDEAYALLNDLGGSLVAAHNAVRLALTEGKVMP